MEIGATTAFNELNSRENYWSGHFMAWVPCSGSSKSAGDEARHRHPHLQAPVVCVWLKLVERENSQMLTNELFVAQHP